MKKFFTLVYFIVLILCTSCSTKPLDNKSQQVNNIGANFNHHDNEYVLMVTNENPSNSKNITYGEAFSYFFSYPSWIYFESTDGNHVVEFSGDCIYQNSPVKATIQFVVDEENGIFTAEYLELNGTAQSNILLVTLIEKVFEEANRHIK